MDFARWKSELESRKGEVRTEIRAGIVMTTEPPIGIAPSQVTGFTPEPETVPATIWTAPHLYIDNTLYVILAGGYLANQFDWGFWPETIFKFGMIFVFTYINIRGIRDVGIVSTILSILVIVAFGMVLVAMIAIALSMLIPRKSEGDSDVVLNGLDLRDWPAGPGGGDGLLVGRRRPRHPDAIIRAMFRTGCTAAWRSTPPYSS